MNRIVAAALCASLWGCGSGPAAPPAERAIGERHAALAIGAAAPEVEAPPAPVPSPGPSLDGALFSATRHRWRAARGAHWQIDAGSDGEDPRVTDAREGTRGACPAGMVQVRGAMRGGDLEALQRAACSEALGGSPERCARYDERRYREAVAALPTKPLDFCIDRFEYPNIAGAYPAVYASFDEAAALCAEQGKRLCSEEEWTFACEGEDAAPYPNGYARDADACSIDAPWQPHDAARLSPARGAAAAAEMDRLWQGRPSGASPGCKSAFGVHDLTGNVDEWTTSVSSGGHPSILKGGYWGPVRARCRPSTRAHAPHHKYYQQGFRCCAAARDMPES